MNQSGKAVVTDHLPVCLSFTSCTARFCRCSGTHREYFYDWCDIGSIYGAPADCLWGGGRVGFGECDRPDEVLALTREYGVSARLTFSNSLLREEHLSDAPMQRPVRACWQKAAGPAERRDRPFGAAGWNT